MLSYDPLCCICCASVSLLLCVSKETIVQNLLLSLPLIPPVTWSLNQMHWGRHLKDSNFYRFC